MTSIAIAQTTSKLRVSAWQTYGVPLLLVAAVARTAQAISLGWRDGFPDFVSFVQSAHAWLAGTNPYEAHSAAGLNLNPPFLLPLFAPFTAIDPRLAGLLWTGIGLLALGWSIRRIASETAIPTSTLLLVLLALEPAAMALRQGQIVFLLLPLFTEAWIADRHDRASAGWWLGLLLAVKPFYGLLAVYWLWRRAWRALARCVGAWLVCMAVNLLLGVGLVRAWVSALRDVRWQAEIVNASIPGLVSRWFAARPYPFIVPTVPVVVVPRLAGVLLVVALLALLIWTARAVRAASRDRALAILSVAAILASPLGWIYYLPVALGPLAMTADLRLMFPVLGLAVPFAALAALPVTPWATLTLASIYGWSTLALWWITGPASARPR